MTSYWPIAVKTAFYFCCFILTGAVTMGFIALIGMAIEIWGREAVKS